MLTPSIMVNDYAAIGCLVNPNCTQSWHEHWLAKVSLIACATSAGLRPCKCTWSILYMVTPLAFFTSTLLPLYVTCSFICSPLLTLCIYTNAWGVPLSTSTTTANRVYRL